MTPEIEKRIKLVQAGKVPAGYKRTKIGIVPKEWHETLLSDYLKVSKEKNKELRYSKEDVFSISGELGIVNQIELLGRSYAGASVAPYGIVKPKDIVYTKSPLKSNPYGIIKANKTGKTGIVSTLYAIFNCKNNVSSDYIQYYFESNKFVNDYLHPIVSIGAKHDMKISDENSLKGSVVFPSLPEQEKIAEILAAQDRVIELKEKLIAEKQKQKNCILKKLVSLNECIRFTIGSVQIDKNKWKSLTLKSFASLKTGSLPLVIQEHGEFPFVNAGCGYSGYTTASNCEGMVITTPSRGQGGIGEVFFQKEPFWLGPLSYRVKPIESVDASFLFYAMFFYKQKILDNKKTGGVPAVNASDLEMIKYPIPTFPEQQAIAKVLSTVDEEITLLQKDLEQEKLKKKSLMQLLLTGLVRVSA